MFLTLTLKTRIILGTMAAMAVVAAVVVVATFLLQHESERRYREAALAGDSALWERTVQGQLSDLADSTQALARNRDLLRNLMRGNDEAVQETVTPTFRRLERLDVLTRLMITDKSRAVVYDSGDTGDLKDRDALLREAMNKGKVARGIQRLGDGIRAVVAVPLFVRGDPVGGAVLARHLDGATRTMAEQLGASVVVTGVDGTLQAKAGPERYEAVDWTLPEAGAPKLAHAHREGTSFEARVLPITGATGKAIGHLLVIHDVTAADTRTTRIIWMTAVVGAGAFLVVVVVVYFLLLRSFRPFDKAVVSLRTLADGDLNVDIPMHTWQDEIGQMIGALAVFKENAQERERLEQEQAEAEERRKREHREMMQSMADDLENKVKAAVDNINHKASDIVSIGERMGHKVDSSTSRSMEVTDAAGNTTRDVEALAESTDGLSEAINNISTKVTRSTEIAQNAVQEVNHADESVQGLTRSAEKIGEVVNLIKDVADQTNLLALNATIEAARAGEAGKGFSVVANEVKNLANQTTKAADDISGRIQDIQTATRDSAGVIRGVGQIIGEVNELIEAIANDVESQRQATETIAGNVHQVRQNAETVQQNLSEVAQSSASTYGSAIRTIWAARDLREPADTLAQEVNTFLESVRQS